MYSQALGKAGRDPAAFAPWANAPPTGPGGPLRRLDGDANYITDGSCGSICDEPHTRGQIWSSALWDIKNRLGLRVANHAIYLHHLLIPDGMNSSMPIAANAMLEANAIADLGYGAADITAVFIQRGILPPTGSGTGPTLVSAATISPKLLQVKFSEQLHQATVTQGRVRNGAVSNPNCELNQSQNFAVTGPHGDHLVLNSVSQLSAGLVYDLHCWTPWNTDETPAIHVRWKWPM